jgi:hypothetical protein
MTAAGIIQLALSLLQVVLGNLKAGTVTSELQTAIAGIQAAITNLESVQGTPVTFSQLESLRVEPKW